ncbi:MAG: tripartite tricarboxylate transporter TctB family protein [Clostridiales bacterium]|nr:tripartite tricarboxylate transporter TctB family protein [Clostridiales bacterium]
MINVVYSTEHWIVPKIVIGVLIVLLLAIIVTEGMARVKAGGSFFEKPKPFFIQNCDHMKLWGTLILFAAYIVCLDIIGFTVTSMIFVFLFNILYAGTEKKSLILSIILAVVSSLIISILFGVVFNITLPNGFCTLTLVDLGITIY